MSTCKKCGQPMQSDTPDQLCANCLLSAVLTATSVSAGGKPDMRNVPTPEELAPLFPQYEIIELLGRGGMGIVYKARQPALDRFVALKILPPETRDDARFAERFTREARALARLSHPNIVGVFEFGRAGELFFFAMEFVDGANVRELMRAKTLSAEHALAIVPRICEALQYAHDEGVMHRDIKPENILIDRKGRVKIADFGLAKILGVDSEPGALTVSGMQLGTPRYMAPEQIEHPERVDHRADIYSLGVVFYEMLTGELPMGCFAPPSKKARIDERIDEIVLHALERDVECRYQHAGEIKTDVDHVASRRANGSGSQAVAARPESSAVGLPDESTTRHPPQRGLAVHFRGCSMSFALTLTLSVVIVCGVYFPTRFFRYQSLNRKVTSDAPETTGVVANASPPDAAEVTPPSDTTPRATPGVTGVKPMPVPPVQAQPIIPLAPAATPPPSPVAPDEDAMPGKAEWRRFADQGEILLKQRDRDGAMDAYERAINVAEATPNAATAIDIAKLCRRLGSLQETFSSGAEARRTYEHGRQQLIHYKPKNAQETAEQAKVLAELENAIRKAHD